MVAVNLRTIVGKNFVLSKQVKFELNFSRLFEFASGESSLFRLRKKHS